MDALGVPAQIARILAACRISGNIFGPVCDISGAQFSLLMGGKRPFHSSEQLRLYKIARELEELVESAKPFRLAWTDIGYIKDILRMKREGLLELTVVDRTPHQEIDLGALAGEPRQIKDVVETPAITDKVLAGTKDS